MNVQVDFLNGLIVVHFRKLVTIGMVDLAIAAAVAFAQQYGCVLGREIEAAARDLHCFL